MIRIAGVLGLLLLMYLGLGLTDENGLSASNLRDVTNRQGFYGVVTLGVAVLIITGAIDLSIGSVVGFSAILFGTMILKGYSPFVATICAMSIGAITGLIYGLLVTKLRLQSFLVTLCGLFIFRGLARWTSDGNIGLSQVMSKAPEAEGQLTLLRRVLIGKTFDGELLFPNEFVVMLALAGLLAVVLHLTIYGRYWYAIGYNERAARFAGIDTDRMRIVGFVLCSTLASFAGVMLFLDYGQATPESAGEFLELYAITGAVLGGCSLKGGEGTVPGMVLGAMVLPLLRNLMVFAEIRDAVMPVVIGMTLMSGAMVDEFLRRVQGRS